jgi:MFS superfamily sulfate permease-like transporter
MLKQASANKLKLTKMKLNKSNIKSDLPSGLVVFLVALPLCLGIAIASGAEANPFSGLIAGIVGGLVVGLLSNSPLSVSGPAAGLATLVAGAIVALGGIQNYNLFLCSVVLAGIIQIVLGALKLGGIANYIPGSVIKGMLTSIGILIIAKQIPHLFGRDKDNQGHVTELFEYGNEDWHELLVPLQKIEVGVAVISIVSILVMIGWDRSPLKKKIPFIPSALVAVVVAVIINQIWITTGSRIQISESSHLVNLPVASTPKEFISFFTLPDFSGFANGTVIMYGFIIAIIASLETLLSIEAIDNLDPERRVTNTNRELFAQGVGNTVSGLIGGLPITSVIVRSSANVNAGAKTKFSTIFHGALLLVSVILIPLLLNKIPLAALAAILVLTGWKLAKPSVFKGFWKAGKYQFIPFIVTVIVIIAIDLFAVVPALSGKGLIIGVFAGIIAAAGAILHGNLKNSYFFHKENHKEGDVITIHLSEEVSFLNKAAIRQTLDHMPANSTVVINASNTRYIDYDVLGLIKEFRDIKAPLKKIKLSLKGFKEAYKIENMSTVQSGH